MMRNAALAPLPVGTLSLLVLIASMPWGGPDWLELALLLLPAATVYFWSLRRPHLLPAPIVLAAGLVLDVLSNGPLGIWCTALLVVALMARLLQRARPRGGALLRGAGGLLALTMAAGIATLLNSLYAWDTVSPGQVAEALLAACIAYPIVTSLLTILDAAWSVPSERSLFVRGD